MRLILRFPGPTIPLQVVRKAGGAGGLLRPPQPGVEKQHGRVQPPQPPQAPALLALPGLGAAGPVPGGCWRRWAALSSARAQGHGPAGTQRRPLGVPSPTLPPHPCTLSPLPALHPVLSHPPTGSQFSARCCVLSQGPSAQELRDRWRSLTSSCGMRLEHSAGHSLAWASHCPPAPTHICPLPRPQGHSPALPSVGFLGSIRFR